MKGIEIKTMVNILNKANTFNLLNDSTSRVFGAIEGILLCYGKLTPGTPWNFKEFDVEVTGWFGKVTIKKREQTYRELMVELLTELIVEQKEK
tara:strand:- start:368 stop:646 length:279 start_codon:yes stop_codon:yes gene_type:complete